MNNVAQSFGPAFFDMYRAFASGVIPALALYSIAFLAVRCWENRVDGVYVLAVVGSFFIALSSMFVSNYSSRYTALGLPLFVLISDRYSVSTISKAGRIALGGALGAASLWTYYQESGWELSWDKVLHH
jgi:hypothetical protein